ncbi:MAG: hypothetical protein M1837_006713 [Sclerophora amabilis]|nr:MAG: hypothetical protein M1837_006713 [Sclerophora amabilis]
MEHDSGDVIANTGLAHGDGGGDLVPTKSANPRNVVPRFGRRQLGHWSYEALVHHCTTESDRKVHPVVHVALALKVDPDLGDTVGDRATRRIEKRLPPPRKTTLQAGRGDETSVDPTDGAGRRASDVLHLLRRPTK